MLEHNLGPGRSAQRVCYEHLRRQILSGAMPGGTVIHQQQIASQLSMSRIPVRDALNHLAAEGLITVASNRQVVTTISTEDIAEIFLMRSALEGLSARIAATRMQDSTIDHLARLVVRMELAEPNYDEWLRFHNDFHDVIHVCCGMPRVQRDIERLRASSESYLRVFFAAQTMREVDGAEHARLLEALKTRDGAVAERAMRAHVEGALAEISAFVDQSGKEATSEVTEERARTPPAADDQAAQRSPVRGEGR